MSTSWEALLLIPANNSFPKADLFLLVDGSDAELLKRLFLLRGLVPLPEGGMASFTDWRFEEQPKKGVYVSFMFAIGVSCRIKGEFWTHIFLS